MNPVTTIPSIYAELYTRDLDSSVKIFRDLIGMEVAGHERDFVKLNHGASQLLLNSQPVDDFDEGNPIRILGSTEPRGAGIEIVVEVPDIHMVYERVKSSDLVRLAAHIQHRDWGRNDFRIVHPDGFYIRITD